MSERVFPVARPESGQDARFTTGLILDVLAVLTRHGYPDSRSGGDYVALMQVLFEFIYGPTPVDDGQAGGDQR